MDTSPKEAGASFAFNTVLCDSDIFRIAGSNDPQNSRSARWLMAKAIRTVLERAFAAGAGLYGRVRDMDAQHQEEFENLCVHAGFRLIDKVARRDDFFEELGSIILEIRRSNAAERTPADSATA